MTTPPASPPRIGMASPPDGDDVSLLRMVNLILRHRWLVLGTSLLCFAIVAAVGLLSPRTYTAESSFMTQRRRTQSTLSGLAAQFGLAVPEVEGSQSPAFYADLLKSRALLRDVVETRFEYAEGAGTLVEIYEIEGRTPELRRDKAIRELADNVETEVSQKTGVVVLRTTADHPELALQINQRLLELLHRFNLQTRQSQAAAERRFTEQRLKEVERDLRAAEDRFERFLQRNRDFRNSPELLFEQDRLQRAVAMQQQLYTTLAEAHEQAKIEEVRDTPAITTVVTPELPARPDSRGLIQKGVLALLIGGLLGIGLAVVKSYLRNSDALLPDDAREFAVLRRETAADLSRPLRPLRRLLGTRGSR